MVKNIIVYGLTGIIVAALAIGAWSLGKKINYSLAYQTFVQETVKEMVKKECLR